MRNFLMWMLVWPIILGFGIGLLAILCATVMFFYELFIAPVVEKFKRR